MMHHQCDRQLRRRRPVQSDLIAKPIVLRSSDTAAPVKNVQPVRKSLDDIGSFAAPNRAATAREIVTIQQHDPPGWPIDSVVERSESALKQQQTVRAQSPDGVLKSIAVMISRHDE